jgi:hypothetical protein
MGQIPVSNRHCQVDQFLIKNLKCTSPVGVLWKESEEYPFGIAGQRRSTSCMFMRKTLGKVEDSTSLPDPGGIVFVREGGMWLFWMFIIERSIIVYEVSGRNLCTQGAEQPFILIIRVATLVNGIYT